MKNINRQQHKTKATQISMKNKKEMKRIKLKILKNITTMTQNKQTQITHEI